MKKIIIALLLLITPLAGRCQKKTESQKLYEKGMEAFEKEQYEKAIENFSESIKSESNEEVYYARGLAYFKLNRLREYCEDLEYASVRNHAVARQLLANNCFETDTIYADKNNQVCESSKFELMKITKVSKPMNTVRYEERDSSNKVKFSYNVYGQDTVYNIIPEEGPVFPGGENSLVKFLSENIKYPAIAREKGIMGNVFITFVVDSDGNVKYAKILRGIGGGCDEESLRVVRMMPRWTHAMDKNKPVSMQFNLPIRYSLK